jgi:hypothetical protein
VLECLSRYAGMEEQSDRCIMVRIRGMRLGCRYWHKEVRVGKACRKRMTWKGNKERSSLFNLLLSSRSSDRCCCE